MAKGMIYPGSNSRAGESGGAMKPKGRAAQMIAQRLQQSQNSSATPGSPGRPIRPNAGKRELEAAYKNAKGAGYAA